MALFTLQRATWSLQISRTSRTFAVSFTTALPRKHKPKHRPLDSRPDSSSPFRSNLHDISSRRSSIHGQTRSAFTSTKAHPPQRTEQSAASEVYRSFQGDLRKPMTVPMTVYVGRKLQAWFVTPGIKLANTGSSKLIRGLARPANNSQRTRPTDRLVSFFSWSFKRSIFSRGKRYPSCTYNSRRC